MARLNRKVEATPAFNHEGTKVRNISPQQELRRLAFTALLWEDSFYETGSSLARRAADLIRQVPASFVAALAIEGRTRMYLRHLPLFLVRELARIKGNGSIVAATLPQIIDRPDELGEYLAIYWGGQTNATPRPEPLSAGSKRGLAAAFKKFNEYSLAKYDRDTGVKLRDVLRLVHAKPSNIDQAGLWGKVIRRELETPDTWEVALSAGGNKREVFERLLKEDKLGGLAFLRNLRNMREAGVNESLIRARCDGEFKKVLPFRFITAAKHVPAYEPWLERAMLASLTEHPRLEGRTALVVDTSPSMWDHKISDKSEMDRFEAAAALAILIREVCAEVAIYTFNNQAYEVPPRRGFALRDAMHQTKGDYSKGGLAVELANQRGYDRIIVLTDGQWHYYTAENRPSYLKSISGGWWNAGDAQKVSPPPLTERAFMINVAAYRRGVGYGPWHSIDGWSERVLDYIFEVEGDLGGKS